ncbi:Cytochrome b561 eukaryote [Penicillium taxi]|uniref:Cytochrome b561 eukaryote n=1 Tax=Penicillium taxi TaxID=168475 RepID=UPI0025459F78|nr:Cytochrome b561 eukaryote [Penicillium taxi]KAJ5887934.1 Cytochrome b561 eukaryote [Penicillium taxi]
MASETPTLISPRPIAPENEPLLGRSGDVTQTSSEKIARNLITGSAGVAQVAIWILAALVWSRVLMQPPILFTAHPLLAISALLLQVQAALILQPTTSPEQKLLGTRIHYIIQLVSIIGFLSAFVVIEVNKGSHAHFTSPHGILGLITVIFIVLQSLVGVVQYFLPVTILGSVDAGKTIYKYHRWSGYALLLLESVVVVAATQTSFNKATIHIPTWPVVIALIIVLAGVGARIKKHKLGL